VPPPVIPDSTAATWPQVETEHRDPDLPADRTARNGDVTDVSTDVSPDVSPDMSNDGPSYEEIARAAYALYEARGGEEGRADEDWFNAEQQLRDERHGRRR
jgi:hypothetical protein